MKRTEHLLSRITINPKIMLGKPTIRGMRITVEQILRALSAGISENELLEEYPELEKKDFPMADRLPHVKLDLARDVGGRKGDDQVRENQHREKGE